MNRVKRSRQPLMSRFFGKKEYVWIKCLVGNKYIIIGPFENEEKAQKESMENLKGVVFDTFHLKTKDRHVATKELEEVEIGKGRHSQKAGGGYADEDDDGNSRIHFV
jgi:hypothetical protein